MMNFLNDGKASGPEMAARNVRAKREADEAGRIMASFQIHRINIKYLEREYRKGVHWLETLRIRKVKTLEGGCNVCASKETFKIMSAESLQSLESFIREVAEALRNVLSCYMTGLL